MLAFVPEIFEGESLYSWLARWGLRSGMPSTRVALAHLIGKNHRQLMSLLPSYAETLSSVSGHSVQCLVEQHSALPYWRAFTKQEVFNNVLNDMSNGNTQSAYSRLSIVASRVAEPSVIRYCPRCAASDLHQYGVAFWHTEHQLPGVIACATHRVMLVSVPRSRSRLVLPPQLERALQFKLAPLVAVRLAQLSRELLEVCWTPLDNEWLIYAYSVRLAEMGFASPNLNVRQQTWRSELEVYWNPLLSEPSLDSVFSLGKRQQFPACIVRGVAANHHPLKHLLMVGALFESVSDFMRFSGTAEVTHQKVIERHARRIDREKSQLKLEVEQQTLSKLKTGQSLRQVAKTLGGSVSTFKRIALRGSVEVKRRTQKLFEEERRIIWRKLTIGKSTQAIAAHIGCSVGAVEQELGRYSELPVLRSRIRFYHKRSEHRANLVATQNSLKTPSRKQIQDAARASYTWLFKHDKDWLYKQLPEAIPRAARRSSKQ
ncbi:TnsD family Tn7-like transposition protein [Aliagarivorans taiwanensis]|uniref:TnsD family Tn7-like transposition protein n=1 Tax=Aliagarivorans taiwanensis TaxID=561966 RepID=UPI0004145E5F|nr:TnsD family Tn7-like transposition protein [Aliagarivorans taiwanensis]